MPQRPLKICRHSGCNKLTRETYCETHKKVHSVSDYDKRRGSAAARGYGYKWQKASKTYLLNHPFCVRCLAKNVYEKATVVDHIKPHKGNQQLFWNKNNWQALCKRCHDIKTATEDGGFGR